MQLDLSTPQGVTLGLLPEILLSGWALVVLLVASWRHSTAEDSRLAGWLSLAGIVVSAAGLAWLWVSDATPLGLAQMMTLDPFRYAADALILLSTAGAILLSLGYLERELLLAPEYYPLLLLSATGMMFMAGAEDLIVLFLGLEVMSVAVYVLAGYNRANAWSSEAALKYFLIGAFASGFLLYGIALAYGATGTTNLSLIGAQFAGGQLSLMAELALGLLLIGFAFKVAAVPFHMWAPDVYDGAPTPVTAFMATGVKIAAFAALVRVLMEGFPCGRKRLAANHRRPCHCFHGGGKPDCAGTANPEADAGVQLHCSRGLPAGRRMARHPPGRWCRAALFAAYSLTTLASFGFLAALGRTANGR